MTEHNENEMHNLSSNMQPKKQSVQKAERTASVNPRGQLSNRQDIRKQLQHFKHSLHSLVSRIAGPVDTGVL